MSFLSIISSRIICYFFILSIAYFHSSRFVFGIPVTKLPVKSKQINIEMTSVHSPRGVLLYKQRLRHHSVFVWRALKEEIWKQTEKHCLESNLNFFLFATRNARSTDKNVAWHAGIFNDSRVSTLWAMTNVSFVFVRVLVE
jgi:hypothetical protein